MTREDREGALDHVGGVLDVGAEDGSPDDAEGQPDHLVVDIDRAPVAGGVIPPVGRAAGLFGHERRVGRDLLASEQRLDEPSLALPELPFAGQ